jgi:ATP adenylyltransferase
MTSALIFEDQNLFYYKQERLTMQDIGNAATLKQKQDMQDLAEANACLFCPEGLDLKKKRVFHRGKNWYVTPNDFPYKGTTVHVMIVPVRHVTGFTDLKEEELLELPTIIAWVNKEFDIKGAGLFCRYGDTTYTGATIHHFHIHIAQGHEKTTDSEPVFALVGYKPPQP